MRAYKYMYNFTVYKVTIDNGVDNSVNHSFFTFWYINIVLISIIVIHAYQNSIGKQQHSVMNQIINNK